MRVLHVGGIDHRRGLRDRYLLDLVLAQRTAGHDVDDLADPTAAVVGVLHRTRPDVVHLHHAPVPSLLAAAAAASAAGVPTVLTLDHDLAPPDPAGVAATPDHRVPLRSPAGTPRPLAAPVRPGWTAGLGQVDVLVCASEAQRRALAQRGLDPVRLVPLDTAIDVDAVAPARRPGHGVLYAGRIGHDDGLDVLVDAVRHLPRGLPVTIAGDGPARAGLERQAAEVVPGRVTFRARLDEAERHQRMRDAAVVVVPARADEFRPRVLLEAFSAARPVVATRTSGLSELVDDGVTGALVEPDDPHALAEALRILTMDPAVAFQQGREARRRAEERFALAGHVAALDRIYAAALSRRHVA
ncbi:glycosyltransferase family 4 protein [Nocardioides sp. 1609]|uniref:glycosyltransferase family 4 protein n=1 Tax=Nocardioides sp. 1609 TaxID=2508327 RepID=UPI00107061C7|nr:glycosyltransferase family 4 protein [Nocardioides sp. 1609]